MDETRLCKYCCMEIPRNARKCGHCGEWLNYPIARLMPWVIVFSIILGGPLVLEHFVVKDTVGLFERHRTSSSRNQLLAIENVKHVDGITCGNRPAIFVVGEVKNNTDRLFDIDSVEVRYLSADGEFVNAFRDNMFGVNINPGETTSFRVDTGEFGAEAATLQTRITAVGSLDAISSE